jgi:hypothetical protein
MGAWTICSYWTIAIVLSHYYAYRGYMGNWFNMRELDEKRSEKHKLSDGQIISVFCIHDALFHFVSSLAGFLVLALAFTIYGSFDFSKPIDAGKSIMLTFSFLFGFIGATGQLPLLILQGKLPFLK